MIPIGIQKYRKQAAYDCVLALLKQEKGNPLSLEDISYQLNIEQSIVSPIIQSIQETYDLCQKNNKYFLPDNRMRWWLVGFGLVIAVVYTVCGYIKYYNL